MSQEDSSQRLTFSASQVFCVPQILGQEFLTFWRINHFKHLDFLRNLDFHGPKFTSLVSSTAMMMRYRQKSSKMEGENPISSIEM